MLPLEDILVVSIEQAVAAPVCTARLSEAGARVIKIERETGDFARGYDNVAGADIAYGAVNDIAGLSAHPALTRRSGLSSQGEIIHFPARPIHHKNSGSNQKNTGKPQAPRIGQRNQAIHREFA